MTFQKEPTTTTKGSFFALNLNPDQVIFHGVINICLSKFLTCYHVESTVHSQTQQRAKM